MIELGDKVKCKHTGFTGIAVVRSEFINGCIQYEVLPRVDKDGKHPESVSIDEQSLEVVKTKKKKVPKEETGGPSRKGIGMRGF